MSSTRLVTLGPDQNAKALAINDACPIEADFSVVFDRRPSFFERPDRLFDDYLYRGVEVDGELVAYAGVGYRTGWLPGGVGRWFYGGELRVLPPFRRRGFAARLGEDLGRAIPADIELGWSLVQEGNRPVEAWREQADAREPDASSGWLRRSMGRFCAHNIMFRGASRALTGARCRPVEAADVPAVVEVWEGAFSGRLFAPPADADRLQGSLGAPRSDVPDPPHHWLVERDGKLLASAGVWDTEAFHRTRVLRMSPRATLTRGAYQALRWFHPALTPLPRAGESFRGLYLVDLAVRDRDPEALQALLRGLLHAYRGRGYHFLHLGLAAGDPLERAVKGLFTTGLTSQIHLWYRPHRDDVVRRIASLDPYLDISIL